MSRPITLLCVALLLTACSHQSTPSMRPPGLSASSMHAETSVTQLEPEWKVTHAREITLPQKKAVWATVATVADQSVPAKLNRQQRIALDQYIQSRISNTQLYPQQDPQVQTKNTFHALPDGSVMVAGRVDDYMAPNWLLQFSVTGSLVRDFSSTLTGDVPAFLGYADGVALVSGYFGDGGGANSAIVAIVLSTGEATEISNTNLYLGSLTELEADFLPKECDGHLLDTDLPAMAERLSAELQVSQKAIHIGKICRTKTMTIVPFFVPSKGTYGYMQKHTNGKHYIFTKKGDATEMYPPAYVHGDGWGIALVHAFERTESGAYTYAQEFFHIDLSTDTPGSYLNDSYYRSIDRPDFCKTHSCVKLVQPL